MQEEYNPALHSHVLLLHSKLLRPILGQSESSSSLHSEAKVKRSKDTEEQLLVSIF